MPRYSRALPRPALLLDGRTAAAPLDGDVGMASACCIDHGAECLEGGTPGLLLVLFELRPTHVPDALDDLVDKAVAWQPPST
eukprot:8081666-Pyramimonas_sp.AAC.1